MGGDQERSRMKRDTLSTGVIYKHLNKYECRKKRYKIKEVRQRIKSTEQGMKLKYRDY